MFALTPFERNFDLFDPFSGIEDEYFKAPKIRSFRTDIKDEGDKYVMEAELPGFEKEDIKLDITGDTMTLSAEHKAEKEEKGKNNYIRRERSYGSYKRSFDLTGIDSDKIEAQYKNGILELTLPKMVETKPESRRLEIK